MLNFIKEFFIGSKDIPPKYPGALSAPNLSSRDKRRIATTWLRKFELTNLDYLRQYDYKKECECANVTLVAYTFPRCPEEFLQIEFAVRHTWRLLGRMKTVIIADHENPDLTAFKEEWSDILDVQYESTLCPGTTSPMSLDCITRLHSRFATDYCLIIQDDGFPMRDNLSDFVGKYDYLGCSTYRSIRKPLQRLIEFRKRYILNGGFTLRTKTICRLANEAYKMWIQQNGEPTKVPCEDVFYTRIARQFPFYEYALKFPTLAAAREFSVSDLYGSIDIHHISPMPFGFHDVTTAIQFIPEFASMGYTIPTLP